MRRFLVALGCVGCLLGGLGCPPGPPVQVESPAPPLRSLNEIVSAVEDNAARLDRALWSQSVSVTARFKDDHGKEHVYNLDSNFLFQRPQRLRMDLRPGLGDQVMQIGSNDDDFWIWIEPELRTMRWGRHRHVGKPCAGTVEVRPDQLAASLGLSGLPGPERGLLGPVRKFGRQYDILQYLRETTDEVAEDDAFDGQDLATEAFARRLLDLEPGLDDVSCSPLPGRSYILDREYWIDRFPPHQIRVTLFRDGVGRISMSAFLDDYRPAWEGGPQVPHAISIIWPKDDGKFTMSIAQLKGMPAAKVGPKAFARPRPEDLPPKIETIIQVDETCDEAEAER